jgi:putative flippase GtrA
VGLSNPKFSHLRDVGCPNDDQKYYDKSRENTMGLLVRVWDDFCRLSRISIASRFIGEPNIFLRYVGAGSIAALVEFSLFSFLYQMADLNLLLANCISFAVAVILCFILQKNWTFKASGNGQRYIQLYLIMQAISAVLNNALMYIFVFQLGIYAPISKILEIAIVFLWNYSFCRLVVFAKIKSR